MRTVIQRVSQARVLVAGQIVGEIGSGMVILLGVGKEDERADIAYMVEKVVNLRIFSDAEGKMNLSVKDVGGSILVVSQFTLYGDCRKGRRPSFIDAAPPKKAAEYYHEFINAIKRFGIKTAAGEFQATMEVQIYNDGPVTLLIDTRKVF